MGDAYRAGICLMAESASVNNSVVGRLPLQYLRAVSGREKEMYKQRKSSQNR